MADKLGVSKADILDPVRAGIAEAHVLKEVRQFLKDEGVHLEAFEARFAALRRCLYAAADKCGSAQQEQDCAQQDGHLGQEHPLLD